ncbi:hypothetical protein AGJ35_02915 [Cronobacter dublinensis subsp. dublinensis]|nr:hypothetical protein [Cronobacter dublinensis subsp. dublinensis]EGT5736686.1 hypothetical protein [Cronobacter dublinensis subsp. dublinensis]
MPFASWSRRTLSAFVPGHQLNIKFRSGLRALYTRERKIALFFWHVIAGDGVIVEPGFNDDAFLPARAVDTEFILTFAQINITRPLSRIGYTSP